MCTPEGTQNKPVSSQTSLPSFMCFWFVLICVIEADSLIIPLVHTSCSRLVKKATLSLCVITLAAWLNVVPVSRLRWLP